MYTYMYMLLHVVCRTLNGLVYVREIVKHAASVHAHVQHKADMSVNLK